MVSAPVISIRFEVDDYPYIYAAPASVESRDRRIF